MNTKPIKSMFVRAMYIMVILTVALSVTSVAYASSPSPFIGNWQARDVDGSDIRLTIAGLPTGYFNITWIERHISFCNREAGIISGTGRLNESDSNLLEADLHVKCFTTGATLEFHVTWRFHPTTNMLSSRYDNRSVIVWHRPSQANVTDLAVLITAAQREGSLTVIALPENWCNYGALIHGFTETYGIPVNSVNPGGTSADELQAIRDGIGNPGPDTPDVIDVGPSFAVQAKSEGLITPYKASTWDTIPKIMKDVDGYWYADYYGVMAIAANTTTYSEPSSWGDLLIGDNIGPVALGGDPTVSNMGFFAVYGAALANNGSLDNIEPGLSFFRNLKDAGRFLPSFGNAETLASGETPVLLEWSYLGLAQRDAYPGAQIKVVVPQPSPVASFYTQAVSAYAPHPNAARLWMEYLYSDAGQLAFLQGYCFPARFDDLLTRSVIPGDLLARLPDITGAVFPSLDQTVAAKTFVEANWVCKVYGECP